MRKKLTELDTEYVNTTLQDHRSKIRKEQIQTLFKQDEVLLAQCYN